MATAAQEVFGIGALRAKILEERTKLKAKEAGMEVAKEVRDVRRLNAYVKAYGVRTDKHWRMVAKWGSDAAKSEMRRLFAMTVGSMDLALQLCAEKHDGLALLQVAKKLYEGETELLKRTDLLAVRKEMHMRRIKVLAGMVLLQKLEEIPVREPYKPKKRKSEYDEHVRQQGPGPLIDPTAKDFTNTYYDEYTCMYIYEIGTDGEAAGHEDVYD